jgi:hypothetical protein
MVCCFSCDGRLLHWEPQEEPWTEHAKSFHRCSYVRLIKGESFVHQAVHAGHSLTTSHVSPYAVPLSIYCMGSSFLGLHESCW